MVIRQVETELNVVWQMHLRNLSINNNVDLNLNPINENDILIFWNTIK